MSSPHEAPSHTGNAARVLAKPFRSPFKTATLGSTDGVATETIIDHPKPSPSRGSLAVTDDSQSKKPQSLFVKRKATTFIKNDSDVSKEAKLQRDLELLLKTLRGELNTVQQAARIEQSQQKNGGEEGNVDDNLVVLERRWKVASRQAAQAIYGGMNDKINRLGGPEAWRELKRRQRDFQQSFYEADVEHDRSGDDDHKAEEYEGYEELETAVQVQQEETEFTMSTMLCMLQVNKDVLDYDDDHQCWKE